MTLEDTSLETENIEEPDPITAMADINESNKMETEGAKPTVSLANIENNTEETPFTTVTYRKQKTKGKRKEQARISHPYKNEGGSLPSRLQRI
jgi:hypothetical protein